MLTLRRDDLLGLGCGAAVGWQAGRSWSWVLLGLIARQGDWFSAGQGVAQAACTALPGPEGSTASARNARRILPSRPYPRCVHQAADLRRNRQRSAWARLRPPRPRWFPWSRARCRSRPGAGPDRQPVTGRGLPLLVLEVRTRLRRPGHTELDAARVDQKSHDLVLSGVVLWSRSRLCSSLD